MDRLTLSQTRVEELRTEQQQLEPEYAVPAPGSVLKLDDDVMWLIDLFTMRIVWGHVDPLMFVAYSPEHFGEYGISVEAQYVIDRAPADPNETPMPIYPQQQQQQQQQRQTAGSGSKHDKRKALQHVLKQLSPEHAKKVRELVRAKKPELLEAAEP